ncbi:MAG TPA: hypothetical protein PLF26_04805 [Blastocatellia bacterium]|nr:hypothetical protein [Blastocatellia bacterium]
MTDSRQPGEASALPKAGHGDSPAAALEEIGTHLPDASIELRRAFDRLAAAISDARDAEAEQFRAAVASLAGELRDREAAIEYLAREVRKRDQMISSQHATIAELQTRVEETAVHARNMEAHADIAAERERATVADLETQVRETATHARNLEAALAEVEARARGTEEAYAFVKSAYDALLSSRGGRLLTRYAATKRAFLGRRD